MTTGITDSFGTNKKPLLHLHCFYFNNEYSLRVSNTQVKLMKPIIDLLREAITKQDHLLFGNYTNPLDTPPPSLWTTAGF